MIAGAVAGALTWLAIAVAAPWLSRRLPPAVATRLLVTSAVVVASSGVIVGALIAFTWLAGLPDVIELGPWSAVALRERPPVPTGVAAGATALLAVGAGHAVTTLVRRLLAVRATRRNVRGLPHADRLIVVADDRPDAFSTPPPDGRVVVTSGLLHHLDPAERSAVLAHEESHLRHGHSWWVMAADLAAAVNPMLIPTARAVRDCVERWADESAAAWVGDRRLVARTLARTALLVHAARTPGSVLAATQRSVPQRVQALLRPATPRRPAAVAGLVALLLAVGGATTVVERAGDAFLDHAHQRVVRTR